MLLPALVDENAAAVTSSGSLRSLSNNQQQQLSSDTTPFTSYTSSPLHSSYTSNGLSTEEEIDSILNFEFPEGFDLSELLY
uniref:Uncharacterized protein n=1 Tax=Kalanchoe fedtschenkoi TaxID=63787 RepID=A0A7N1A3I2_KALFE